MDAQTLEDTAKAMVAPGKGLLAIDESTGTCNQRFEKVGIPTTNAMNVRFKDILPWPLTFSYARAIQKPALEVWKGEEANIKAAQKALLYRARCNAAARNGEYSQEMEGAVSV